MVKPKQLICIFTAFLCTFSLAQPIKCEDIAVSAKAAIVYCPENGEVLYSKNIDSCLQMASTTKIMSTILTIESGNIDDLFTVDSEAIMVEGSSMGLLQGDIVSKRMLCYGMMLPSGNDAANAAAIAVAGSEEAFVDMMNKKACELGLTNTHFVTPSGLDDYTDEHYSTAYDMAKLTAYALENDIFREICATANIKLDLGNDDRYLWLYNSNRLLSTLSGCIGVKTGFTDKAGRCLVTACERNGVTLICVTLFDPNDWQDHVNLYNECFSYLAEYTLGGFGVKIPAVGGIRNIALLECDEASVVLLKGDDKKLTKTIIVPRFVYAPLTDGETVGRVIYKLNGKKVISLDLKLSEELKK